MKKGLKVSLLMVVLMVSLSACGDSSQWKETQTTESEELTEEVSAGDLFTEPAIETLKIFGSMYSDMEFLGEPKAVTPLDKENVILNYGHFTIAEYDGLTATFSVEEDFALKPDSGLIAITLTSDSYTNSNGIRVGMSKEELMKKYFLAEEDFLSAEEGENGFYYCIRDDGILSHKIPEYDFFYPAYNLENPIAFVYLVKDERVVAILLRHMSAG